MFARYRNLRRIERLDPATDFNEIFELTTRYEFPWDYLQGTSVAFLRDYGVPSISALLDRTGEFRERGLKRYDDTLLIGQEATIDTLESDRGRAAIRHLNGIHGRYRIPEDEFLYVLCTTIVGPKRWIDRYGWRRLHPHELVSMARVTSRFGELMGLKDLPGDYDGYERYLVEYEAERFEYAPQNRRLTDATYKVFTDGYPAVLAPALRRMITSLLDEPLRVALGLPAQPAWLGAVVRSGLRLRAAVLRLLFPPRRTPYLHRPRSYPAGYRLADLGPSTQR